LPFSLLGTAVADNLDSYKQATQSLRTTSARGFGGDPPGMPYPHEAGTTGPPRR
jgi:hypothetical protein